MTGLVLSRRLSFIRKFVLKRKRLKTVEMSFIQTRHQMKADLSALFSSQSFAADLKLIYRIALNTRQLNHDARRLPYSSRHRISAKKVLHFISTPWGDPFNGKISLLEAADKFTEQDPQYSDLYHWLSQLSSFGEKELVLKMFHQ